jgi:hypothetical protein
METIGNLLRTNKPLTKNQTERSELLGYFHRNVNYERDGVKFKKLPIGAIARKLQGLNLQDLHYLMSICEDAQRRGDSWGKCFWGSLKPREEI